MTFIRAIFAILLAPFIWLLNLPRGKNSDLEWRFNYGPSFVKIETKYREQFLADDLLIASYLLFLARYFFICDERQPDVVRNYLLEAIKEKYEISELGGRLYEVVFQTLNQTEKDATLGLLKTFSFIAIPPMTFSEGEEPRHSFAKYSFLVFNRGGQLGSTFHMSFGPDIILLPLTVGILYAYVVNKLRDKNKKEKLDRMIIELLEAHDSVDSRSMDALNKLPMSIISKNHLNY